MNVLLSLMIIMSVSLLGSTTFANADGEVAFNTHCLACHDLHKSDVGPSLLYIRNNYPLEQRSSFIEWTQAPGRVNSAKIRMPAMIHVPKVQLAQIHDHILHITKGVKHRSKFSRAEPFVAPPPIIPYTKRRFMPFASPAAIAVVINHDLGIAWDASLCKVRYAFPAGTKHFFAGEKAVEKVHNKVLYKELVDEPWSFFQGRQPTFNGYRLKEGLPTFYYTLANVSVEESIMPGKTPFSFLRQFVISGLDQYGTLDLSHNGNATISTSTSINNNKVSIPRGTAKFLVEVTIK